MNVKAAVLIAVLVVVAIYYYLDSARSQRAIDELRVAKAALEYKVFEIHHLYASHMGGLVHAVDAIRNDEPWRDIYSSTATVRAKLDAVQSLLHDKRKRCDKILTDAQAYVLCARDKLRETGVEHRPYENLLERGPDGKDVLKAKAVPVFDINAVTVFVPHPHAVPPAPGDPVF